MMSQYSWRSIIAQVAALFMVGILTIGVFTYISQHQVADGMVTDQTETIGYIVILAQ